MKTAAVTIPPSTIKELVEMSYDRTFDVVKRTGNQINKLPIYNQTFSFTPQTFALFNA